MSDRPDRRDKAAMGRWIGVPPADPAAGLVSTIVVKGDSAMSEKASGDGFYTTTDEQGIVHRFVVRKGDTVPEGATFEAGEQKAKQADAPADAPKWYRDLVKKANGTEIPARLDGETEAAYRDRTGPTQNQQGVGPSETTDAIAPEQTS